MFASRRSRLIRGSIRGGPPPDRPGGCRGLKGRALLSPAAALSLCAVGACALLFPPLVLGSGRAAPDHPASVENPSAVTAVVAIGGPPVAASDGAAQESSGRLFVRLPWGGGDGQVALANPSEGLVRGPEAVAMAADGRVVVLDSVNRRLVLLSREGGFERSIPVPLACPRFLAVGGERLYVLDGDVDRRLMSVDWDGGRPALADLPALDDVVTGLFATDAGPCVEVAHDRTFLVSEPVVAASAHPTQGRAPKPGRASLRSLAGRPVDPALGPVAKVTFRPEEGLRIRSFKVDRDTLRAAPVADRAPASLLGPDLDHLVSVDGDGRGGLLIGGRLLQRPGDKPGGPSLVIARLAGPAQPSRHAAPGSAADARAAEGVHSRLYLSDCPFAYLGPPYVVTPDGRIIQPVADETGYSLLIHALPGGTEVTP